MTSWLGFASQPLSNALQNAQRKLELCQSSGTRDAARQCLRPTWIDCIDWTGRSLWRSAPTTAIPSSWHPPWPPSLSNKRSKRRRTDKVAACAFLPFGGGTRHFPSPPKKYSLRWVGLKRFSVRSSPFVRKNGSCGVVGPLISTAEWEWCCVFSSILATFGWWLDRCLPSGFLVNACPWEIVGFASLWLV